ncbi:MAG: sugar ABC transporter permease [Clostridia bacterium]|nr:sugar ABC transporter permease [Clostridia bacterium]
MDKLKGKFKINTNIRQFSMLIALVVIMVFFQWLTGGILLTPQNVTNLIMQNGYVIILTVGMLLCIVSSGSIDLSVGSVVAFVGAVLGELIVGMGVSTYIAIPAALVIGALIGAWQGFWIAYMRIPAFIVTLAGMLVFRGLTQLVLQGHTVSPFPEGFTLISSGFVATPAAALILGGVAIAIYVFMSIRRRMKKRKNGFAVTSLAFFVISLVAVSAAIGLFALWLYLYKGVPVVLVLMLTLIIVYSFFVSKTVPGRYLYAMGGNEKAAILSGIKTKKVLFLTFVNMSVLAAVAGIVYTSRLQAATPTAGLNFELDAIAACFIGGASNSGGVGTVIGAVIGALVMGVLNNGLSIMGVGSDLVQTIKGLVLLAAVVFDIVSKSRAKA